MVERLYPGVYVTEIPFHAKPIEGVSTSTTHANPLHAAAREVPLAGTPPPAWTQHNDSDPGVTFVQLFAWLNESMLFAAQASPAGRVAHAPSNWGVAQGLAVDGRGASDGTGLHVRPGSALTPEGRPIAAESTTTSHRVKKP